MKRNAQTTSPRKGQQPVLLPALERLPTQNASAQDTSPGFAAAARKRPVVASPVHTSNHSVELHIEELVLHGFPNSERYRIGEALERELARLFIEQGLPPAMRQAAEIEYLKNSVANLAPDVTAEEIGTRIAQSVYGGLSE